MAYLFEADLICPGNLYRLLCWVVVTPCAVLVFCQRIIVLFSWYYYAIILNIIILCFCTMAIPTRATGRSCTYRYTSMDVYCNTYWYSTRVFQVLHATRYCHSIAIAASNATRVPYWLNPDSIPGSMLSVYCNTIFIHMSIAPRVSTVPEVTCTIGVRVYRYRTSYQSGHSSATTYWIHTA